MASFGIGFLPGAEGEQPSEGGSPQDRYQQAVRILSLRLPRFLGGSAIAPAPLLEAMGGQGEQFGSMPGQVSVGPPPMGMPPMGQPPSGGTMPPLLQQAFQRMSGMRSRTPTPARRPPARGRTPRVIPGIQGNPPAPSPEDFGPNAPGWTPPEDYPGQIQSQQGPISAMPRKNYPPHSPFYF